MYTYGVIIPPMLGTLDAVIPLSAESIGTAVAMAGSVVVYMAVFVWAMMGEDRSPKRRDRLYRRVTGFVSARLERMSARALFLWALGTTASFPVEHWAWENIGPMATLATFLGVGTK